MILLLNCRVDKCRRKSEFPMYRVADAGGVSALLACGGGLSSNPSTHRGNNSWFAESQQVLFILPTCMFSQIMYRQHDAAMAVLDPANLLGKQRSVYVRAQVVARQQTGFRRDRKDGALVELGEPSSTARKRSRRRSVQTEPTAVRGRGRSSSRHKGRRWSSATPPGESTHINHILLSGCSAAYPHCSRPHGTPSRHDSRPVPCRGLFLHPEGVEKLYCRTLDPHTLRFPAYCIRPSLRRTLSGPALGGPRNCSRGYWNQRPVTPPKSYPIKFAKFGHLR